MLRCCDTVAVVFSHFSYTVSILLSGSSRRLLLVVGIFPVIAWVVGAVISVSGLVRGHTTHSALHIISLALKQAIHNSRFSHSMSIQSIAQHRRPSLVQAHPVRNRDNSVTTV
jgi:hypothetical protein